MKHLPRFLVLVPLAVALALSAGCISPPPNASGTAYINGGITLGPLEKMPPLAEQGIDRLGLVMESSPSVGVQTVALSAFGNKKEVSQTPLLSDEEKRQLFVETFNKAAVVQLRDVGNAREVLLPAIKFSSWSGKPTLQRTAEVEAAVAALRSEGIDALLCIFEDYMGDFIGMTNQRLESQGLYRRFETTAVYGGFIVSVLDLRTFTLLPRAQYTQGLSHSFDKVPWKDRLADYSREEQAVIQEALRAVFVDNVVQTAAMLKATP